jgi:signal transduction histidine kinase
MTELLSTNAVLTDERRLQYYTVMARDTERLHRLVEGLLDFGRMENHGRGHSYEEIDPVELTESTVAEFQSGLPLGGHRVELNTNGLKPQTSLVHANREALARAIRNLLENAVKYSPDSPLVRVGLAHDQKRVAIHVHDDGFGITAEEHRSIFEKFVRGAASKALNVPGTGIGLAMTQHIVKAHGGEINLKSEPGSGTTLTILLPMLER